MAARNWAQALLAILLGLLIVWVFGGCTPTVVVPCRSTEYAEMVWLEPGQAAVYQCEQGHPHIYVVETTEKGVLFECTCLEGL